MTGRRNFSGEMETLGLLTVTDLKKKESKNVLKKNLKKMVLNKKLF